MVATQALTSVIFGNSLSHENVLVVLGWAPPSTVEPRPGPTQQPVGVSAGLPRANQLTGEWQPHSLAHRLPTSFLSPQPPLHTPLDQALPTRSPAPTSICQWTGPSPALAARPALLTRGQTPHQRKPQSCNGMSPHKREARPYPGISRSLALPTSRATQALRHPRPTPNCVSNRSPVTRPRNWVSPSPASNPTTAQGSLSPITKLQDPALPTSRPALNPALGFSHQWAGNGPGIFWALPLPTSEPAPTQGP